MARKPQKPDKFGLLFGGAFSIVGVCMFLVSTYMWGGQYLVCTGKDAITCDLEVRRWFASKVVDRKHHTNIKKLRKGKMCSSRSSGSNTTGTGTGTQFRTGSATDCNYSMSREIDFSTITQDTFANRRISEEAMVLYGIEPTIDDAIEQLTAHIESGENRTTSIESLSSRLSVYMSIFAAVFSLVGFGVLGFWISQRMKH